MKKKNTIKIKNKLSYHSVLCAVLLSDLKTIEYHPKIHIGRSIISNMSVKQEDCKGAFKYKRGVVSKCKLGDQFTP